MTLKGGSKPPLSPAVVRDIRGALRGPDEDTMVPCPACEACVTCHGAHIVSVARRIAYRQPHEIDLTEDPDGDHE